MSYLLKKLVARLCALIFFILIITYIILLCLTSLYRTIPANIPFFTSIPKYRNRWQYTAPTHLTQPSLPHFTAAFISFVDKDSSSLSDLRSTIRSIEDVFNKNYNYPYIIFSAEDLSTEYKELVSSLTNGDILFEKVSKYEYGYRDTTDQFRAYLSRKELKDTPGNTEEFRFKSRLMAGAIFNHTSLSELDYFWRFEPGTEYMCPIDFDPFQYMQANHKELSFSIATYEQHETIPTLYRSVMKFKKEHPEWSPTLDKGNKSIMSAMVDDKDNYNRCYFWNNFQVAKTSFFKSPQYQAFFNFIDKEEGIFYERWADPVIQSLAAALFLNINQIHMWENIGYRYHWFYAHCPSDRATWEKCSCRPEQSFDNDGLSCLAKFK